MHHEYYTKIVNELKYDSSTNKWTEKHCSSSVGRNYFAKSGVDHKSIYGFHHQSLNLATHCFLPGNSGLGPIGT